MDDLTRKRLEQDHKMLQQVGDRALAGMAAAGAELDGLKALEAEAKKHFPGWAADLLTMPSTMMTFALSRLRQIGAPAPIDTLLAMLTAAIDETAPRVWPQPGTERPAWVREAPGWCDCGGRHPGDATDLAAQVIRLAHMAYAEIVEVIATEMIQQQEISSSDESLSDEARAAENARVQERVFAAIRFHISMFEHFLPPL